MPRMPPIPEPLSPFVRLKLNKVCVKSNDQAKFVDGSNYLGYVLNDKGDPKRETSE